MEDLEKAEGVIWPSLIVGPAPENFAPCYAEIFPWYDVSESNAREEEAKYNMDPTSLVLIALELYDIREEKDEAFEYFV